VQNHFVVPKKLSEFVNVKGLFLCAKLLKERHQQAEEPFGEKKNAEQN